MTRWARSVLLVVALLAAPPGHGEQIAAAPDATPDDAPPPSASAPRQLREFWVTLTPADRAFVRDFISTHNLSLITPALLALRAQGDNAQAKALLSKAYHLDDPAKAELIMKVLAYAHGQY